MKRLGVLWLLLLVVVGVYAQTNYAIYRTSKDEMTGDMFQYYVLYGTNGGWIMVKHNVKEKDTFTVGVAGAGYLVEDTVKVWLKYDDGKIIKTVLPVSNTHGGFFINGVIGQKFIDNIYDKKKLIIRVFVPYDSPVTFVFDLTSLQRTVKEYPIIDK